MLNTRRGIPFEDLFGAPTVLELRSVGDDDEKCFLMALLLVQLYEYQEQMYRWNPRQGLRHVTVIEESHRLLGSAGPAASMEMANPRGKAVESFANMLAEIREYGEGFLIIDQTPSKLIPDVRKNTSTKILHRLSARDDRDAMGDAMGMTEDQKLMIPRLRVGDAIFYAQDQDKPIWIKVPPVKAGVNPVTDAAVRDRMAEQAKQMARTEMDLLAQQGSRLASRMLRLSQSIRKQG